MCKLNWEIFVIKINDRSYFHQSEKRTSPVDPRAEEEKSGKKRKKKPSAGKGRRGKEATKEEPLSKKRKLEPEKVDTTDEYVECYDYHVCNSCGFISSPFPFHPL